MVAGPTAARAEDLLGAFAAVGEALPDDRVRIGDRRTVGGHVLPVLRPFEQLLQARQVLGEVAVGRRDHGGRPSHDVVAGAEVPFLAHEVAEVVRRVPGRVHGLEAPAVTLDDVTVAEHDVGAEVAVATAAAAATTGRGRPRDRRT